MNLGEEIICRLADIARCSEPGPGVTRMPFTREHRDALSLLKRWMQKAQLEVFLDDAGTLVGRRQRDESKPTLLIGSHQDSIPQGGAFDGILGIVLPILCLEQLKDEELNVNVEILAFADEEGVRFPTALIGSRSIAGTLDPGAIDGSDAKGVTVRQAMMDFGLHPDSLPGLARDHTDIRGFVEVHIEQGPVLEDKNLAVGVVTAICGIERWAVVMYGRAAHAGTTPMELRKDALSGAAEVIAEVERHCRETSELVGVVGSLHVIPNAVNVIPAEAHFTIELRSSDDSTREAAGEAMAYVVRTVADRRGLGFHVEKTYAQSAVQCDKELSDGLLDSIYQNHQPHYSLMSGATHDASAMSDLCPVAMLFVRCKSGISHHHEESITADDADMAAKVLIRFLKNLP